MIISFFSKDSSDHGGVEYTLTNRLGGSNPSVDIRIIKKSVYAYDKSINIDIEALPAVIATLSMFQNNPTP